MEHPVSPRSVQGDALGWPIVYDAPISFTPSLPAQPARRNCRTYRGPADHYKDAWPPSFFICVVARLIALLADNGEKYERARWTEGVGERS